MKENVMKMFPFMKENETKCKMKQCEKIHNIASRLQKDIGD